MVSCLPKISDTEGFLTSHHAVCRSVWIDSSWYSSQLNISSRPGHSQLHLRRSSGCSLQDLLLSPR